MNEETVRMPEEVSAPDNAALPEPSQPRPPVHSWNAREAEDARRRAFVREKILRHAGKPAFREMTWIHLASVVVAFLGFGWGIVASVRSAGPDYVFGLVILFAVLAVSGYANRGLWEIQKVGKTQKLDSSGFRRLRISLSLLRGAWAVVTALLGLIAIFALAIVPAAGVVLLLAGVLSCFGLRLFTLVRDFVRDLEWVAGMPDSDLLPDPKDFDSLARIFAVVTALAGPGILGLVLNGTFLEGYLTLDVGMTVCLAAALVLGSLVLFRLSRAIREYRLEGLNFPAAGEKEEIGKKTECGSNE